MSNVESESVKDVVIDHQNVPAHVTRDDTGRDYVDMEVNVDNQTPSKVLNKAKTSNFKSATKNPAAADQLTTNKPPRAKWLLHSSIQKFVARAALKLLAE